MSTTTVTTPIPKTVSFESMVNTLHRHPLMIAALAPAAISHTLSSGDPGSHAVYSITDKKPMVGETTYSLTLTNTPDGVDSLVNAKPPVGTLQIASKWRVVDGELREDVDIDANFMVKRVAKGNVEKNHVAQHLILIKHAQKA
ncbi:hypothetical protein B0A49_12561 [Cryomyces minteri]|uniref:DUF7053 domain-containing protein n=1 Tax=Cryomyces minteri TaxID=331657 RepID=A0A4U0VH48_9PEZI|nr:hypothetical protein B0A49_12561 [Cryomyces minteri]